MSDYQTPGTLAPNTQNLRRSVRAKAVWRRHAVRNGSLWWQTTCFKSEVCLWTKEEQCDTLLIARDLSCHQSWPFCQASWWHVTRRFGPQLLIKVLKLAMRSGKVTKVFTSWYQTCCHAALLPPQQDIQFPCVWFAFNVQIQPLESTLVI